MRISDWSSECALPISDMIRDTEGVARDALAKCRKAMEDKGAEAVILGCTIIAASMEKWLIDTKAPRDLTILNTNTFSLKMAESLEIGRASCRERVGQYV